MRRREQRGEEAEETAEAGRKERRAEMYRTHLLIQPCSESFPPVLLKTVICLPVPQHDVGHDAL